MVLTDGRRGRRRRPGRGARLRAAAGRRAPAATRAGRSARALSRHLTCGDGGRRCVQGRCRDRWCGRARARRERWRGCGRRTPRIPAGRAGAAGQAHLQPVPPARRARTRRASTSPGSTASIEVDPAARTADVQGMCTYEDLVDATLPARPDPARRARSCARSRSAARSPGSGIESTSFRNGLPHESVLEMDVLTGAGEVVTATPGDEHAASTPSPTPTARWATPPGCGSSSSRCRPYVALRHVRFDDAGAAGQDRRARSSRPASGTASGSTALDGVAFEPGEFYLTLARWTDRARAAATSDYTGQQVYYRSLQQRETDLLTMLRLPVALGHRLVLVLAAPSAPSTRVVRRLWPRRWRRSRRLPPAGRPRPPLRHRRPARPARRPARSASGWSRTSRSRSTGSPEFLDWFDDEVGMRPVWLCPLRLRGRRGGRGRPTR